MVVPSAMAVHTIFAACAHWEQLGLGLLQAGLTVLMVPTPFSSYALVQVLPLSSALVVAVTGYCLGLVLIYSIVQVLLALNWRLPNPYKDATDFLSVIFVRFEFVESAAKDYGLAIASPLPYFLVFSLIQVAFSMWRQMLFIGEVLDECRWWAVTVYGLLWLGVDAAIILAIRSVKEVKEH